VKLIEAELLAVCELISFNLPVGIADGSAVIEDNDWLLYLISGISFTIYMLNLILQRNEMKLIAY
jgi:hypothetical protein